MGESTSAILYLSRIQPSSQLRSRSVIGIELELLMSGDFIGSLELSNHPDDSSKSGG